MAPVAESTTGAPAELVPLTDWLVFAAAAGKRLFAASSASTIPEPSREFGIDVLYPESSSALFKSAFRIVSLAVAGVPLASLLK